MSIYISVLNEEDFPVGAHPDEMMDLYGSVAAPLMGVGDFEKWPGRRRFEKLPWGTGGVGVKEAEGSWDAITDYGLWAVTIPAAAHMVVSLMDRMKRGVIVKVRGDDITVERYDDLPRGQLIVVSDSNSEVTMSNPGAENLVAAITKAGGSTTSVSGSGDA